MSRFSKVTFPKQKVNLDVEVGLHNAFKPTTAVQGKFVTEAMVEFTRDYIRRNLLGGQQ